MARSSTPWASYPTIWLGHKGIAIKELLGSGKTQRTFAEVSIEDAAKYAAEDADLTLRLWLVLKPRLPAENMTTLYETIERPLAPGAGAHGRPRHHRGSRHSQPAVGRFRPARRRARGRGL